MGLFDKPSPSALGVALQRAIHQIHDARPLILDDPMAVPILGTNKHLALEKRSPLINEEPFPALRSWLLARSRYTEDVLGKAVEQGARQYVLLGAGLDTFAFRNPFAEVKVFEVDRPVTQRWKRKLSKAAKLESRYEHRYVPVDFRSQDLGRELEKAGLDGKTPTVFGWLGVVYFLPQQAFRTTLNFIAGFPSGSSLIMDYWLPREMLQPPEAEAQKTLAEIVARAGEPYRLFFSKEQMAQELSCFSSIEDVGAVELQQRYFATRGENGKDTLELGVRSGFCRMLSAVR